MRLSVIVLSAPGLVAVGGCDSTQSRGASPGIEMLEEVQTEYVAPIVIGLIDHVVGRDAVDAGEPSASVQSDIDRVRLEAQAKLGSDSQTLPLFHGAHLQAYAHLCGGNTRLLSANRGVCGRFTAARQIDVRGSMPGMSGRPGIAVPGGGQGRLRRSRTFSTALLIRAWFSGLRDSSYSFLPIAARAAILINFTPTQYRARAGNMRAHRH